MNRLMRHAPVGLALSSALFLGGCASSLSGVGSTEHFACQAPVGAQCTSISGVYANSSAIGRGIQDALPPLPLQPTPTLRPLAISSANLTRPAPGIQAGAGTSSAPESLRSPSRVLRMWVAPWEDADGDLHDAAHLHVVVDTGRWLIERARPAPRSRLDIATPPVAPTPAPTPAQATPMDAKPDTTLPPTEP